jgi:hypothetical protein
MDYLRSAYRTTMIFRVGDDPVPIQWYRCDPGAKPFKHWTVYASSNWISRDTIAGELGEQPGPKPWDSGVKPANGGSGNADAVICGNVHPDWYLTGIPVGESTGPFEPSGLPTCCVTPPKCCGCRMPATISLSLFAFGCVCIPGSPVTANRVGGPESCLWETDPIDCDGAELVFTVEVEDFGTTCDIRVRIFCDDDEVGTEAAAFTCTNSPQTVVINPIFNDCCDSTFNVELSWVPVPMT